jgi:two-component system, NtrC family, response regulator HydG
MPRARAASPRPARGATAARILVVDDSADTLELIQRNLALQGYDVHTSPGAADALALLDAMAVDLVVTDVRMPGLSGIDLIREVRQRHPGIELVVITGYATIEGAVEALQSGAWDYLAKPFTDEELFLAVRRALARRPPATRPRPKGTLIEFHGLLGRSRGMTILFESIKTVAPGGQAVLVCGEPGTGHESVARALHACSGRAGRFVRVSLDARRLALPGTAIAKALEESAASCAGGTLYLASLDVAGQEVLEGVSALPGVARAGWAAEPVARLVASAAEEPAVLQRRGGAMAGLLPRFEAIVAIPPLRERGEDVVLLARRFLAEVASDAGTPARGLSRDAESALRAHAWPGNVRELRDLCVRLACSGGSGLVEVGDLPAAIPGALGRRSAGDLTLQSAEREHIARILQECGGNKSRAAEVLGIDRKTLRDRLRNPKRPAGSDPRGR